MLGLRRRIELIASRNQGARWAEPLPVARVYFVRLSLG
jgi:hypothetical protein